MHSRAGRRMPGSLETQAQKRPIVMPRWLRNRIGNGPTRDGWYYLVVCGFVLGGAIVRDINLLLLFAGLLLAPLLFNGYLAGRTLHSVQVGRRAAQVVVA